MLIHRDNKWDTQVVDREIPQITNSKCKNTHKTVAVLIKRLIKWAQVLIQIYKIITK